MCGRRELLTRVESCDAVLVRELHTTEERVVEGILSLDARVRASAVAVPHVGRHIHDGQARGHVDELHLDVHRDAALALGNVGADILARDVVRADGGLGHEGARVVAAEEGRLGRAEGVVRVRLGLVVADLDVLEQLGHVALLVGERLGGQAALAAHVDGLGGAARGGAALQGAGLGAVLAVCQRPAGLGVGHVAQGHLALDVLLADARVGGDGGDGGQEGEDGGCLGHCGKSARGRK